MPVCLLAAATGLVDTLLNALPSLPVDDILPIMPDFMLSGLLRGFR